MSYTESKKPLNLDELTTLADDDGVVVGDQSDSLKAAKYITWANIKTMLDSIYQAAGTYLTSSDIADFETTSELDTRDTNNRARANHTGTQTASTISDFDTEVSNNTDVAANTAARHDAVTVTDSTEIDFTLTGQDITASLKAGSIDETKLDTSVNASLDLADSAVQPGDNVSDLTNDAGYKTSVTEGDVTQHEAALTITESQISDLGTYIEASGVTYENLDANGDVGTGASQVAQGNHTHDDRYYTETEVDGLLDDKADVATVTSLTSDATPDPTGDSRNNELIISALAENATLSAPSGTPAAGNQLYVQVTASGATRTIGYNAIYADSTNLTKETSLDDGDTLIQLYRYIGTSWVLIAQDTF